MVGGATADVGVPGITGSPPVPWRRGRRGRARGCRPSGAPLDLSRPIPAPGRRAGCGPVLDPVRIRRATRRCRPHPGLVGRLVDPDVRVELAVTWAEVVGAVFEPEQVPRRGLRVVVEDVCAEPQLEAPEGGGAEGQSRVRLCTAWNATWASSAQAWTQRSPPDARRVEVVARERREGARAAGRRCASPNRPSKRPGPKPTVSVSGRGQPQGLPGVGGRGRRTRLPRRLTGARRGPPRSRWPGARASVGRRARRRRRRRRAGPGRVGDARLVGVR